MPELPEVETQVRGLQKLVKGKTVKRFISQADKMYAPDVKTFTKKITGQKILKVDRKGKFIIFRLESREIMVCHLRMTGHFLFERGQEYAQENHIRGIFELDSGDKLLYQDIRMFGKFWIGEEEKVWEMSGMTRLGEDVHEISEKNWLEQLEKRKGVIKSILLDQSFVAGIGNIYADEALFDAGISPLRRAETLKKSERVALHKSAKKVILSGIKHRGTTIGEYRDLENQSGTNQNHVQAYGKKDGDKCPRCGKAMRKIKVAQRGTVYCAHCQK